MTLEELAEAYASLWTPEHARGEILVNLSPEEEEIVLEYGRRAEAGEGSFTAAADDLVYAYSRDEIYLKYDDPRTHMTKRLKDDFVRRCLNGETFRYIAGDYGITDKTVAAAYKEYASTLETPPCDCDLSRRSWKFQAIAFKDELKIYLECNIDRRSAARERIAMYARRIYQMQKERAGG